MARRNKAAANAEARSIATAAHGLPVVVLVGRANVGKSTLFNRMVRRGRAIVSPIAGTTRDLNMARAVHEEREFVVIDSGGLELYAREHTTERAVEEALRAVAEADVVVFVIDGRAGVAGGDIEALKLIRETGRPTIVAVNKIDRPNHEAAAADVYALGVPNVNFVSAAHGLGVGELLDAIVAQLPAHEAVTESLPDLRLALIGRPNVGKSSLLNRLAGFGRSIVDDRPGTTRDPVDVRLNVDGRDVLLIDTAGIRRRGHIIPGIERHSVQRAQTAVERCDVALVVMDATEPVTAQDTHILQIVEEAHKGLVLVLNKTDLLAEPGYQRDLTRFVRRRLRFVPWAPITFVSALKRTGLPSLLHEAIGAAEQRDRRVATGPLNTLLQRAIVQHAPPSVQGKRLKLLYTTQAAVRPPTFVLFVNDTQLLHFSFERYVENRLREAYGFEGTAIRIIFKARSDAAGARAEDERRESLRETAGVAAGASPRARPVRPRSKRRRE